MPVDQNEIITARAVLLAAKRTALIDAGFSADEAWEIVLADIKAGLTETGLSMNPALAAASDLVAPPDLSELLGNWEFVPSIQFDFRPHVNTPMASFVSTSIMFNFVGGGQEQMEILFSFGGNVVGRAVGTIISEGHGSYNFLGGFQNTVFDLGLRVAGTFGNGNFGAAFHFIFPPLSQHINVVPPAFPRVLTRA